MGCRLKRGRGDKSVVEEGNENLNQGNILLAPRTEAEAERAKDERGGRRGDGGDERRKSGGQWEEKRVEGKGWRQAEVGKSKKESV